MIMSNMMSDYDTFLNQNKTRMSNGFRMGGSIKQDIIANSFKKKRTSQHGNQLHLSNNQTEDGLIDQIVEEDEKESIRSFSELKDFDDESD